MSVPVHYELKSKGVAAIPKDKLIRYSVLNSALKTHKNLTPEDRHFAITHILGLNIDDTKFTNFVLQTYKLSNTGRFSLTFNMDLDQHIKSRKSDRLPILIVTAGTKKAWPELYDNSYLTKDEIEVIEEMSNREYYSILTAIETANCLPNIENVLPCSTIKDEQFTVNDKIKYNSLYSKCYEDVCLSESEIKGKIISLQHDIPQVAYVADTYDKNLTKFCFPVMEIIENFARSNFKNPKTNTIFSNRTISQIQEKYKKEIAMYKKYLDILKI